MPPMRCADCGNDAVRDALGCGARRRLKARLDVERGATHAVQNPCRCSDRDRARRTGCGIGADRRRRGRSPVAVTESQGIVVEQRPAFREYVVRERVPTYTIPDQVVVGTVLPEAGVTYYDVPQTYGATPYRYTVVNGETVLVEPRTRRIVQVIE
jgi:hypothetical protein